MVRSLRGHFNQAVFIGKQRLFRPRAFACYQELLRTQYLPPDELAALNWQRRKALLAHAFVTVPYYQEKLRGLGLCAEDIRTPDDWQRLPLLTRNDVIENRDRLLSPTVSPRDRAPATTGGSTGVPLTVYHDLRYPAETLVWRMLSWWEVPLGSDAAHSWRLTRTSARARLANTLLWWPTRRIWLDASAISPEDAVSFLRSFNRLRPPLLQGYVGAIHHLASFIEQEGLAVHSPQAIWLTAAPVSAVERALIQKVFQAPVYDQYGSCETRYLAAQCSRNEGLHIMADAHHVEFVAETGIPCAPGEFGRIVVTDTTNLAFPLIRYVIGDTGRALPGLCSCGRTLPLMDAVKGRVTDMLRLPDGAVLSGDTLTTLFDDFPEAVTAFQVVQQQDWSIVLRVVPNRQSPSSEAVIRQVVEGLRSRVKGLVPVTLEVAEAIAADRGKTRFVISHAGPAAGG